MGEIRQRVWSIIILTRIILLKNIVRRNLVRGYSQGVREGNADMER